LVSTNPQPHQARDSPSTRSPNPSPPASFISPELFPDQPPGASPIACFTSPELYPDQPRCIIDPPASSRRNSSQIYPVHPVPVVLLSSKPRHCPLLRSRNSGDKLRDLNRATLPCSARGISGDKLHDVSAYSLAVKFDLCFYYTSNWSGLSSARIYPLYPSLIIASKLLNSISIFK